MTDIFDISKKQLPDWLELVISGKPKTAVASCLIYQNRLILADVAGNISSLDMHTGKKNWSKSIKVPKFGALGLYWVNESLYVIHNKGLDKIDIDAGKSTQILSFRNIHSPLMFNGKLYAIESAQWSASKGNLIEIDIDNQSSKIIFEASQKRDLSGIRKRDITAFSNDSIVFFADGKIMKYDTSSTVLSTLVEGGFTNIGGIICSNEHVFFIPDFDWERNKALRSHPWFQKIVHHFNGHEDVVETRESFLASISYTGFATELENQQGMACLAGVVFLTQGEHYKKVGVIYPEKTFTRPPDNVQYARWDQKHLMFFDLSFGHYAEQTGFSVFEASEHQLLERAQFIGAERKTGFASSVAEQFGEHIVIHGQRFYHVLRLKGAPIHRT